MNDNILLFFAIALIALGVAGKIIDKKGKNNNNNNNRKEKVRQFVMAFSPRYLAYKKLNLEYSKHFLPYTSLYNHRINVNSKQKVDAFDFYLELGNLLSSCIDLDYIENCFSSNQHWYKKYCLAYDRLPGYLTQEQFYAIPDEMPLMSYKEYQRVEQKLNFSKLQPNLSFKVVITVSYTSPKGNSHHEQNRTFSFQDCRKCQSDMYRRAQEQNYRNEERKKMTPALRYEVLRRDGFRCTICGRGSIDGVKLHVDHIKPISKGGKTELSNLRTLCQDCNLGKSDHWNPGGVN